MCATFRAFQQEDAHEFLLGLLSRMEDSVLAAHGKVPRSVLETNVIRRIFGGTTRSEGETHVTGNHTCMCYSQAVQYDQHLFCICDSLLNMHISDVAVLWANLEL